MSSLKFQRSSLRAPLYRDLLYVDDRYVHKARGLNISEGGILISELPHVPDIRLMHLMLDIPQYPDFYALSKEQLLCMDQAGMGSAVVRARARIVRSFEGQSDVEKVFVQNIGCQFVDATGEFRAVIAQYLVRLTRNTIFLLNLFESSQRGQEQVALVRKVAKVMGYAADEKMFMLRQKVLHDYHSLEGP